MIKKIKINSHNKVYLCNINKNKYVLVSLSNKDFKYFFMPFKTYGIVQHGFLYLLNFYNVNKIFFNVFCRTISLITRDKELVYKKQLRLRGVGFKMLFSVENSNVLELKLGYSHLNFVNIPSDLISTKIKKRKLVLESSNKLFLGNFVYKLLLLKYPDVYKSKGFLLKYKNFRLKFIKKK